MKGLFVDSNVILDIFLDYPNWADWSESALVKYTRNWGQIFILDSSYCMGESRVQVCS